MHCREFKAAIFYRGVGCPARHVKYKNGHQLVKPANLGVVQDPDVSMVLLGGRGWQTGAVWPMMDLFPLYFKIGFKNSCKVFFFCTFLKFWNRLVLYWFIFGVNFSGCCCGKGGVFTFAIIEYVLTCCSHVQLFCDPMDYSLPGSSVCGISQSRMLEWVAISASRGSSWPRDWSVFCFGRQILYHHTNLGGQ